MGKATVTANPGESTIHIERMFDAPRDKVFALLTDKSKISKWWLGPGYTTRADEMDVREGGRWKFVQTGNDGTEFAFFGSYHEVAPPERIIQTFEFSGLPERGHVSMEKMELHDAGNGKTKMTVVTTFFSAADRDGMLQSGMEDGMNNTYDAFDKLLAEQQ
ncbi:MAG TPA: SRPBCC family protein [Candidatus Saccharimonadales bacterium]|nr:SRPBCC family protein [Candidatus Saccharimonadales bacterium]